MIASQNTLKKFLIFYGGFYPPANHPSHDTTQRVRREVGRELSGRWLSILSGLISIVSVLFAQQAFASIDDSQRFSIAAGPAGETLPELARVADVSILYDYELVSSVETNSVSGEYTLKTALERMLRDTPLSGDITENGIVRISVGNKAGERTRSMAKNSSTRKALLTSASAAMLATFSQGALAQEDEAEDLIVVTGKIADSLANSQNIKRNSNQFVDAVTAENIGKFPDNNVAEALQRIPGVTIDRANGEGQGVTVRGFGPDFNTVLLNGRRLASDAAAVRGFQFDIISAELIGGAEVFKSSPVHLQEGGIGSTINLNTIRPLDAEDLLLVKASGTYEQLSEEIAPSAFGLFSRSFADDTLGVLGAVSFQRRNSAREDANSAGYLRQTVAAGATDGFANSVGNVPGTYFIPRNFNLASETQQRTRLGINGTVQYRPTDQWELTFDGLYSTFVVDSDIDSLGQFYVPGNNIGLATIDDNNTLTRFVNGNRVNAYIQTSDNRDASVLALAGNLAWSPSDNFRASLDVSYSTAENDGTSDDGANFFTVIRDFADITFDNTAGGIPLLSSSTGYASDLNALTSHFAERTGSEIQDDIFEVKLDAEWTNDEGALRAVRGGVLYSMEERVNDVFGSASPCFNCGDTTPIPGGFATLVSSAGFLSSAGGGFPDLVDYDAQALFDFYESPAGLDARDANLNLAPGTSAGLIPATGYDNVLRPGNSFAVDEDVFSVYAEAEFGSDEGLLPWTLVAGFRFVETDVRADGTQRTLLDLVPIPNDPTEFAATFGTDALVEEEASYSNFLPSVQFKVSPTDELVLRAGWSQTLTRPALTDLTPVLSFPSQFRPSLLNASAGNVNLTPFESTNIDVSAEYYYSPSSFISVAYFTKEVDGFIVTTVGEEPIAIDNSQGIMSPLISGQTATFNVSRPQNLETATVNGFELSLTHTFDHLPAPFDGFGVQANATFVDSDAEVDVNETTQSFALAGLGDSRSFVGFYENNRFNARLAYTVRDEFLVNPATGAGGEPLFTDDFGQLDARVTIFITDNVEFFVDGINLTNETRSQRGRFANHFVLFEETGARYSFGATARF